VELGGGLEVQKVAAAGEDLEGERDAAGGGAAVKEAGADAAVVFAGEHEGGHGEGPVGEREAAAEGGGVAREEVAVVGEGGRGDAGGGEEAAEGVAALGIDGEARAPVAPEAGR
jgi:hypothetical protein